MSTTSPLRVLWICGLPEAVRQAHGGDSLSPYPAHAWSWVLGHLPPPKDVDLHIASPALGLAHAETLVHEGATFHLFPQRRLDAALRFWRWGPSLQRIVREVQPEIVHGWGTESGFGLWASRLTGKRGAVSIQGLMKPYCDATQSTGLRNRLVIADERTTLQRAGLLLTESLYSNSLLHDAYGLSSITIPHPLRPPFLEPEQVTTGQSRRIIFTGNICHRKGALDAATAFLNASLAGWELVFLGKGADQTEIESLAKAHGNNHIRFAGMVDTEEMIELMQDAPIFLLPSRIDTGPTALKEALAMGLWPICYDNTGPQELIHKYRWGSLVPTGNIPELSRALQRATESRPWQDVTARTACAGQVKHDLAPGGIWCQLTAAYLKVK